MNSYIFVLMRNITITLDDDTAKWVRVLAAMRDTSVSRLVGDMLRGQRRQEAEYDSAMIRFLGREAKTLKERDEEYPDSDSLHERPLLTLIPHVLVYCRDLSEPEKQPRARQWLEWLW